MPSRIPDNSRDDSEAVADLLGVLWRRVHHETMRRIDSPGITPARLRALRFVGRADTPVRMGELAERLGIVPRSATTLGDELADAGWVRRLPDPDDRPAPRCARRSGRGGVASAPAQPPPPWTNWPTPAGCGRSPTRTTGGRLWSRSRTTGKASWPMPAASGVRWPPRCSPP